MAIAQKMNGLHARTFVILGDGELEEGTVWEAAISGAAFKLDNLTAVLDCNGIQKMGTITETIGLDNWKEKWKSFGWHTSQVDGHDIIALSEALNKRNRDNRPQIIIAHTVKGKGGSIVKKILRHIA